MASSIASIQPDHSPPRIPEGGNVLQLNRDGSEVGTAATGEEVNSAVGESWASEFQQRDSRDTATAVSSYRGDDVFNGN